MLGLTKAFGALYLSSLLMQLGSTLLMTYLALRLNAGGGRDVERCIDGSQRLGHGVGRQGRALPD